MLVNTLYIDLSGGERQDLQEYEVQCDAQRKVATVAVITPEDRLRLDQLARLAERSRAPVEIQGTEPHETSDIVFISVCVLAVILMLIAIVWLVLL